MTTALTIHSATDLIAEAVRDKTFDAAKLRELLAVRREWMADEAVRAFNEAVVKFQQRAKIIAKADSANGRAYAKMDRIWREIRPLLDECGLAVTWESVITTGETCTLDGHLRHIGGHAQPIHHVMPIPDKIPGQNATQRAGAAETYCKRYALCSVLGIQTGEDTDGAPSSPQADAKAVAEVRRLLADAGRTEAQACKYLGVASLDDMTEDDAAKMRAALVKRVAERKEPIDLPYTEGDAK